MSDKIKETVREMARLTILSGRINSIQEKSLKMYPLIMFDGVKSATIHYNLGHDGMDSENPDPQNHNGTQVIFDLDAPEEQTNAEKRCKHLEVAVRELLWSDVQIEVMFNHKLFYKSSNV